MWLPRGLSWQRREHMWVGYDQAVHSQETDGSGGAVAVYFATRVPLKIQTSANEQRWPFHNLQSTPEGAGWTTR